MRFYNRQHRHYCGIDLHVKTMYVCILDGVGVGCHLLQRGGTSAGNEDGSEGERSGSSQRSFRPPPTRLRTTGRRRSIHLTSGGLIGVRHLSLPDVSS